MANEETKDLEKKAPDKKELEKKAEAAASKLAVRREEKKPNIFRRIVKWFRDMRSELRKVIWSTPKQVAKNSGIALVFMGISALVIWGFDFAADRVIQAIILVARAGR